MKKTLIIIASLAIAGLIGFQLYANKEEMKEDAKLAEITSKAIPVEVTTIEKKVMNTTVEANGTFEATTDLVILSETQGKVIKVYKEKGEQVSKGQLLAQVENDLLRAEVSAAQANYEKLKADLDRFTKLSENDAVTKRQLEDVSIGLKNAEAQYQSAKKRLENTYIRATTSGSVNDDFIQEGAFIGAGAKLYEIVDVSKLKLNVKLTANEVLKVQEGNQVKVTSQLHPNETFDGKVTSVATKADAALKYSIEIQLNNNRDKTLKPGMYATAHFNFVSPSPKLYLNRNALVGSIQNPQVFTVDQKQAKLKDITIGDVHNDLIEVAAGLKAHEQVVVTGQINLSEGTQVKVLK